MSQCPDYIRACQARLERIFSSAQSRVSEVHEVAGEWDTLAKVKAENNLGLYDLTRSLEISGINKMSTIVAFKTVKENPGVEV